MFSATHFLTETTFWQFCFAYSLAIALATSAPLRDLIKNIVKIVFSYDYANAISSAVGAGHLNIFVEGNSLHVRFSLFFVLFTTSEFMNNT